MTARKVGILGGTFNPVHKGHLTMARSVLDTGIVDEVWMMPSNIPPHKAHTGLASKEARKEMILRMIRNEPKIHFSDFEWKRDGFTYTAETLPLLFEAYPELSFSFIIGGDSLCTFAHWYRPDLILDSIPILAVGRPGSQPEQMHQIADSLMAQFGGSIRCIPMKLLDISSSDIRSAAAIGCDITPYVGRDVADYIVSHHIYSDRGEDTNHGTKRD